eukprot:3403130-Prymnesium_polylepis.3
MACASERLLLAGGIPRLRQMLYGTRCCKCKREAQQQQPKSKLAVSTSQGIHPLRRGKHTYPVEAEDVHIGRHAAFGMQEILVAERSPTPTVVIDPLVETEECERIPAKLRDGTRIAQCARISLRRTIMCRSQERASIRACESVCVPELWQ